MTNHPQRENYESDDAYLKATKDFVENNTENRWPSDYKNPNWDEKEYGPDWKQNVNDELKAFWETFTDAQKFVIAQSLEDHLYYGDFED